MFSKISHVSIGTFAGWYARRSPGVSWIIMITYLTYHVIKAEVHRRDGVVPAHEAYPEIREFGYGLGVGLAAEAVDATAGGNLELVRAYYRYRRWARFGYWFIRGFVSSKDRL